MKGFIFLTAILGLFYILGEINKKNVSDFMGIQFTTVLKGIAILSVV